VAQGSGECWRVVEALERGSSRKPEDGVTLLAEGRLPGPGMASIVGLLGVVCEGESAQAFHSAFFLSGVSHPPKLPPPPSSSAQGEWLSGGGVVAKKALGGGLSNILGGEGGARPVETAVRSVSGVAHGEPQGSSMVALDQVNGHGGNGNWC
jgi:hypothetical protein